MKLAVVVQRYGPAVHGGAERHARYIAEHLVQHADVDVLTTCAANGATWVNEFAAGSETVNGVNVRRFRVSRPQGASALRRFSDRVFTQTHSIADELRWLRATAPGSRSLLRYLRKHGESYDFCLFVGYRCGLTYYGTHAAASRAILVPRADSDAAIGARIFADTFRGARAILFDSPEERTLVQTVCGAQDIPNAVVGAGADVAQNPQPGRFRQARNIRGPFAIYVGRIDEPGCGELLRLFERYSKESASPLSLVLVGEGPLAPSDHPKDQTRRDPGRRGEVRRDGGRRSRHRAVAVSELFADRRRSLGLGKPVLANGASKALSGQCGRSNGGLWYRGPEEFIGMLQALEQNRWLNSALGRNGRQYVRDHLDWRVVGRKYHDMFVQLQNSPRRTAMAPIPGWLERRRRDVSPSADRVRSGA